MCVCVCEREVSVCERVLEKNLIVRGEILEGKCVR